MAKMEDDKDLKLLEQRKMLELRRRAMAAKPPEPKPVAQKTSRQVVEEVLYDRGDEVLAASYEYYPQQTRALVEELAAMVRAGRLKERVSGGELLSVLRQLGLRFSLKTSIKVQEKGKFVELSEKLKAKKED
jgi:DNA-binding TFAR19-related protein (PDSD5 family)